MPAILPSGPCAQVNPLFQAAPSASSLAAWHASKTLCTSSVTKHFSPTLLFLYLTQGISSTQAAAMERNLSEPADLLQHFPLCFCF